MLFNYTKKIWEFLKPSLLPILFVLFVLLGCKYLLNQARSERDSFVDRMKELQVIHDKEMSEMLGAQAAERERHEQNLRQLQQDLSAAVAKHEEKLKELERQKEIESKRLFEKYRNDPTGLAQELSRVTGIPVYVHEDKK